nr:unnamed protein product [Spirometra erinaceieuropaei]
MHPRLRRWHLRNDILVRKRGREEVLAANAICDVDDWTGRSPVISKMKLRLRRRRRPWEITRAVQQLSYREAPDSSGTPASVYKHGGPG